ncbi:wD repeat domain [Phytophthora boehmeriae]|uniref:WD repeat domain n=1 Tax=Phytophthora boehmeriae TaxID=109152 RepID=A0A8T1VKR1_9STRA|nr:wD repeat domain [Phytophthora boehmeriae]
MGKASRKKQQDEQKRQFIANHGDGRSNEERANARAMLDALQKKLEDDALREDGFFFVNGKFADSRKPRLTPGMKMRDFRGHVRNITDIEIVRVPASRNQSNKEIITLFTFGLDW